MAASPPLPCAFCRAPLPPGARFCNECGQAQPPVAPVAPAPVEKPKLGAMTVVGVQAPGFGPHAPYPPPGAQPAQQAWSPPQPAPAPAPAHDPVAERKKALAGTMIGVAVPQAQPPQPAPDPVAERKKQLAGTMIGMASPVGPPPQAPPQPTAPENPKNKFAGTIMGVAVPGVAPTNPGAQNKNIPKGTIMGVAIPGVAPTREPGFQHAPPPGGPPQFAPPPQYGQPQYGQPQYGQPQYGQQQPQYGQLPAPTPPQFAPPPAYAPEDDEPDVPVRKPSRAPVIALLVVAALGIIATLVFVLRPSGPPPLTSSIEGDTSAPKLVVTCETCENGSTIDLGSKSATFEDGKATIAIAQKDLKAGKNVFSGKVVPKGKKPQDVELEVAIPYLVNPSLAPLAEGKDHVDLVFDLAPEATGVEVDGKTIEGSGTQTVTIPVPPPKDDAKTFEKSIAYSVLQKTGKPIAGSLKLAIPYAPLRLGLPGRRPFVIGEELEVSGHTAAGATVQIGEEKATADDKGTFKTKLKVGKETSLRVRVHAQKLAPREVTIALTHAASVEEATKVLRAEAKATPFDAIAAKPDDHVGKVVDQKLEVDLTADEDGRAVAVGDVRCPAAAAGAACPVVRVLLPMGVTVAKGDVIEVLGVVVRGLSIEGGKTTAVEIDGSVVLRQK